MVQDRIQRCRREIYHCRTINKNQPRFSTQRGGRRTVGDFWRWSRMDIPSTFWATVEWWSTFNCSWLRFFSSTRSRPPKRIWFWLVLSADKKLAICRIRGSLNRFFGCQSIRCSDFTYTDRRDYPPPTLVDDLFVGFTRTCYSKVWRYLVYKTGNLYILWTLYNGWMD